jgi:predicted dehydrogenase
MQADSARRQFFRTAAAAIATAKFPILGANDRVNLGIVGLGGRGRDHIDYYTELDGDCRIAAVCDVNQTARERAVGIVRKKKNYDPKEYKDMREVFASKDVDAVSLPLPNHWHSLSTIWACQAGKDVYVEKPASHNIFEGRKMVEAARKYKRMVQVGSQSRTIVHKQKAMKLLEEGVIGTVYHARGLCFRRRFSIGHTPDEPVPAGIDWDRFLGPAQMKPYSKNKFAYNWHWFWDTGNGDIGNQGVHEMDMCLWGLGRKGWPVAALAGGGKYIWKDDQETPNTLQTSIDFGDAQLTFEVRNLPTPPEGLGGVRGASYTGNIFYGEKGFMVVEPGGFQIYRSSVAMAGDAARGASAGSGSIEKYEKFMEEKAAEKGAWATIPHMKNFLDAVRSRNHAKLNADVEIGARAAAFCHLANIAYRVGRKVRIDPATGRFPNDAEAAALATRKYRAPYVVPEKV